MTRGRPNNPPPRMPFGPIERLAVAKADIGPLNDGEIAAQLGIARGNVYYYRKAGLTLNMADRLAIGMGLHPILVWPEWLDVVAAFDGPLVEDLFDEAVA
jgi:hypothetical protein